MFRSHAVQTQTGWLAQVIHAQTPPRPGEYFDGDLHIVWERAGFPTQEEAHLSAQQKINHVIAGLFTGA